MRCHLQTQLSPGLITAITPSKLLLVQSYTFSLFFLHCRNSSQLSQPSASNWSNDWKKNESIYFQWASINIYRSFIRGGCVVYVSLQWINTNFQQITFINEQNKQARRPRKSFGTVSKDILLCYLKISADLNDFSRSIVTSALNFNSPM